MAVRQVMAFLGGFLGQHVADLWWGTYVEGLVHCGISGEVGDRYPVQIRELGGHKIFCLAIS